MQTRLVKRYLANAMYYSRSRSGRVYVRVEYVRSDVRCFTIFDIFHGAQTRRARRQRNVEGKISRLHRTSWNILSC